MTLSLAGTRRDAGVSVAEVNLKFSGTWFRRSRLASAAEAFVVDAGGRLIAHPDISLVLRNTDMSRLAQVRGRARHAGAPNRCRKARICAAAKCSPPMRRSRRSAGSSSSSCRSRRPTRRLYALIKRSGFMLLAGLTLAFLAALFLARRMVVPIQMLRAGAAAHRQRRSRLSASPSRPATRSRRSPTSSTTWPTGCRNPMRAWSEGRAAHARTERGARTADRDRRGAAVISSSPGELEPVFRDHAGERDAAVRGQIRHA